MNYILFQNQNGIYNRSSSNSDNLAIIGHLITNYGNNAHWLQNALTHDEGIILGSLEVKINGDQARIQFIYEDDDDEAFFTILSKNVLLFLVNKWQELIQLKPSSITISEKEGLYNINAQFDSPIKSHIQ